MSVFDRVAYPRLARWIAIGAVLFLLSGGGLALASIHEVFFLLATLFKYLGLSLFVLGGFFYLLHWSVDYGPDYLRDRRT